MDALAFLARVRNDRRYRDQIQHVHTLPSRPARYQMPRTAVPDALHAVLAAQGIEQLYEHQAGAYDTVREGRNVVISTGTASGKSLCYHLPVLAALLDDVEARALYLFPAKALSYDQLGSLERMISAAGLGERARPACYDGDTPQHRRAGIRRSANVILTNPDMLHVSVLPYHAKWAQFFAHLRYVVLDEIHTYRGIFGSHVAGVVRRLQRICRHYGADPTYVCCSATLGNPRQLAEQLVDRPVELIDDDASPRGQRHVVLWNPPLLGLRDEDEDAEDRVPGQGASALASRTRLSGGVTAPFEPDGPKASNPMLAAPIVPVRITRRNANVEAQRLMRRLLEEQAGTITFCKARVVAELIYTFTRDSLQRRRPDLARRIKPYRGGYLPNERREIERQLFTGELLGVCSTTALELGIDVGTLDASIVVGFPGTLCSLWQQIGRAGRRQDESLSIFIAYDDPVDQYLMRHPQFVFDQPLEHAIIDPDNPHIIAAQMSCAASEMSLSEDELDAFGVAAKDVASLLTDEDKLRHTAGRYYWASREFPATKTDLRTISDATYAIIDTTDGRNEVIGQVDSISAPELVYPEAVYLHQGESFLVRELDMPMRTARVERLDADYYTQPVLQDECRIVEQRLAGDCLGGGQRFFGDVSVKWQTIAFRKFKLFTQELIGQTALDLPAQQIDTTGVWLQPPPEAIEAVKDAGFKAYEGLSGAKNLLTVSLPPLAMCDRYDVGGVVNSSQLGVSVIILYDRYQGGLGYARHGYEYADELLKMAYALVSDCPCEDGCPGCVAPPNLRITIHHDPDLGQGYKIPSKTAALALLGRWVGS